jgi:uncharacterized protein YcbK (DUF882 family)
MGEQDMDPRFMHKIVDLRRILDFPFIVTSAFRCPEYNQLVSNTGPDGPHTTGRAIDIRLYGGRAFRLDSLAKQYGMTGIGVAQHGARGSRFLHLDDLEANESRLRPWIWSY